MPERLIRVLVEGDFLIREVAILAPARKDVAPAVLYTQVRILLAHGDPNDFLPAHNIHMAKHMVTSGEAARRMGHDSPAWWVHIGGR